MRAHVRRWGSGLALRLPQGLAEAAGLAEGSAVEVTLVDGRLLVEPVAEPPLSLAALVAAITEGNRHDVVDWGPAAGGEVE